MSSAFRPDDIARGFLAEPPPAERYGRQKPRPYEAPGLILESIPEGARVLDVGCGTGSMLKLMREVRNVESLGLEPDPERAALARSGGFDVLETTLADASPAELGVFDVVLFADVLEHLDNPVADLEVAQRFLRAGGCIVASIPNVAHWSVRTALLAGRFDYQPYGIMDATHLRWFTEETVRKVFRHAGLAVERVAVSAGTVLPVYQETRPWKWAPRKLRRRFVCWATRRAPRLFGCQFVIRARPAADG